MSNPNIYKELSKKLNMENSQILPRIWSLICNEEEAEIINSLPRTVEDIAGKFGKSVDEIDSIMKSLFHKGVVFDYVRDDKTYYRMPRHIVQFHDASILWPEIPSEMLELWVEFGEEEYPKMLEMVTELKLPSFMRVIPINKTIDTKSQVLAYEDATNMVKDATNLAVTTCVCRKSVKKCDAPLEVCLQINRGADYAIKRGTGRKVSIEEAIAVLRKSEEAGLVHLTENRGARVNAICNCCTCCCDMLRYISVEKTKGVLAPSRFEATVDENECTSCEMCIDICPTHAISMNGSDVAKVKSNDCIGCGLCASVCPTEAIILKEMRPEDFIPAGK